VRGIEIAALAAAVVLAAACGGGAAKPDAGPGSDSASDTGAVDTGGGACDPAAQNCGAAMKCDFGCQGTTAVVACWPAGDGGVGAACTNLTTCAAGTACLGLPTAGTACRKYCNVDGDCATGERCHNDTVSVACGATPATSLSLHFCH